MHQEGLIIAHAAPALGTFGEELRNQLLDIRALNPSGFQPVRSAATERQLHAVWSGGRRCFRSRSRSARNITNIAAIGAQDLQCVRERDPLLWLQGSAFATCGRTVAYVQGSYVP